MSALSTTTSPRAALLLVLSAFLVGALGTGALICFLIAAGMGLHAWMKDADPIHTSPPPSAAAAMSAPVTAAPAASLPRPAEETASASVTPPVAVSGSVAVTEEERTCWRRASGSGRRTPYPCSAHPGRR